MAARSGFRDGVEREGILAAAEHQSLVAGRFPARLAPKLWLEWDAASHQPIEVFDAASAVIANSVLIGTRPHRHIQERRHVVDGIIEAASLLQSCAAAEVDEPARRRGRATPAAGAFDDEHVGTCSGGLDRRARTRYAVPRDDNVGFVIPVLDLVS
jgi:hypothetical protein